MRVIAGQYKNRVLQTPKGLTTRPLLSRIRKSLFDILQPHLEGARFLDLFSGTGALSMEAFSRGAVYSISIDNDLAALDTAKENHKKICPQEQYRVIQGNVLSFLPKLAKQEKPFDIISITPPYGEDLNNKTLAIVNELPDLYHDDTIIYAQRDKLENTQLEWSNLEHVRTKKYGRTIFDYFLPKIEENEDHSE